MEVHRGSDGLLTTVAEKDMPDVRKPDRVIGLEKVTGSNGWNKKETKKKKRKK